MADLSILPLSHDINPGVLRLLELAGYNRSIYTGTHAKTTMIFWLKGTKCESKPLWAQP